MLDKRRKSLQLATGDEKLVVVDFLPEIQHPVIVHCEEFSCLAYLDHKGIWRTRYKGEPVGARVLGWEPV